jgi:hypothetical protein
MRRHGVVDAIAQEGNVGTARAGELDDARLVVGADACEDGRVRDGRAQRGVVEALELGARAHALDVDADVAADLDGHGAVVAGDDLHPRCRAC